MDEIHLRKLSNGFWFGRIVGSDDGLGNEIECVQETPQLALEALLNI